MRETLEVVLTHMEELREDSKEFLMDTLRSTSDKLTVREEALEALVTAMKEEIAELKGELTIYKAVLGSGMLASGPKQHNMDVPKPEKFKGARFAREVDNFLWELEQYFRATSIEDDATKVNTASIYFIDVAFLWWRCRSTDEKCGGTAIGTWEDELMLQISDLNNKEAFYWFEDGLKMWAKQELRLLGITDLTIAMAEEKNFYDVGGRKFDNSDASKPKPRLKGNGGGDKDQTEKNGEAPMKKAAFNAIKAREEDDDDTKSLGTILGSVKDKTSNGLMFVDIIIVGRRLNTLIDTGASDLFMSKEMAKELGLKIEEDSGRIKTVNSESIPITGLGKGVELKLGEWTCKATIKVIPLDDYDFV
ncbi:hypothetical protein Golob_027465, partial [Gossypium lobatum]|nr:hypothetical protein [Gossypium lobatum]